MSHGDVVTTSTYFFVKESKLAEVKPFFDGLSPQHTKYIWENQKITKDNSNFK